MQEKLGKLNGNIKKQFQLFKSKIKEKGKLE
jgi:hypothetical protein